MITPKTETIKQIPEFGVASWWFLKGCLFFSKQSDAATCRRLHDCFLNTDVRNVLLL